MTIYNLTILQIRPGAPPLAGIERWQRDSRGAGIFLACWFADIGCLNQVLLLHAFSDVAAAQAERAAWIASGACFGCPDALTGVSMRSGPQMSGVAEVAPGKLGPVYEVRTYLMAPHDYAKGKQAWADALPARAAVTKPLLILWSTEGPATGLVHIWPYATLEQRGATRREVIEMGVWPPKDGARYILSQQSDIFLPAPFSPLS
jgi:hypothetical protein